MILKITLTHSAFFSLTGEYFFNNPGWRHAVTEHVRKITVTSLENVCHHGEI